VYRKQVFAARSEFSFRAVIVSITDQHDYECVKVPWPIAVTFLEYHITNKLIKRGMSPNAIKEHLYTHAHRYSALLAEVMDELIKESPYKGIPIILGRNPSLKRGLRSIDVVEARDLSANDSWYWEKPCDDGKISA
jgi:hypothetical protein